jgi:hypothetical protein
MVEEPHVRLAVRQAMADALTIGPCRNGCSRRRISGPDIWLIHHIAKSSPR